MPDRHVLSFVAVTDDLTVTAPAAATIAAAVFSTAASTVTIFHCHGVLSWHIIIA